MSAALSTIRRSVNRAHAQTCYCDKKNVGENNAFSTCKQDGKNCHQNSKITKIILIWTLCVCVEICISLDNDLYCIQW